MYKTEKDNEKKANVRSRFATALVRLLDDTRIFNREQWARVLGISEPAISQWVQDKTIPRPEMLRAIRNFIKSRTKIPSDFLEEFENVCKLPADEVSPLGHRIAKTVIHYSGGDTIGHYLVSPVLETFLRNLSALPPDKQEEILLSASEACLEVDLEAGTEIAGSESNETSGVAEENLVLLGERHKDSDVRVVSSQELMSYLDAHRGLHVVGGKSVSLDLVGMFNTEHADDSFITGILPSCAIVLWKLPPKGRFLSFPLDEMMFFLLRGRVKWNYDGAKPINLGTAYDEPRWLWMGGGANNISPTGLPPFYIEVESEEPAVGLGVFYAKGGVRLNSMKGPLVELQTNPWLPEDARRYWEQAQHNYGELTTHLPVADTVPAVYKQLEDHIMKYAPNNGLRGDVHDPARREKQIFDADFPRWNEGYAAVLESRIVKFRAPKTQMKAPKIYLGHHEGKEIIIPLLGTFKYVVVEPTPSEMESLPRYCDTFPEDRRKQGYVQSAAFSNLPFPDVLLLNSNNWHGFSGVASDAYCLHIRCRAPRESRSRNSLSSQGREATHKLGGAKAFK